MTLRAIHIPGREPRPDGGGLPLSDDLSTEQKRQAAAENAAIAEHVAETTMRPLHYDDDRFGELVRQRMREMTPAERVFREVDIAQRRRAYHSFNYDACSQGPRSAEGAPASPARGGGPSDVGDGGDCWGSSFPAPVAAPPKERGWY